MMYIDVCAVHMILSYTAMVFQHSAFTTGLKFTIQCQEIVSNLGCISSLNPSRLIDSESRGINVMFPSSLPGLVFLSGCKQLVRVEV